MPLNQADKKFLKFVLKLIEERCPNIRKPKYSNEYYIRKIIFMLRTGCSYRDLDYDGNKRNHYSSIQKKYKLYCTKKIFEDAYNKLIKKYNRRMYRNIDNSENINLFIDSTQIRNKNGKTLIGRNIQDKSRFSTKISCIVDKNKIPVSISFYKGNVHDVNTISPSIHKITINNNNYKNIIGDKGYIVNKLKRIKFKREQRAVLITPYRKNQKEKNTTIVICRTNEELRLLKSRSLVENFFASLKQFKRIQLRYDSNIDPSKNFVYMASSLIIIRSNL